MFDKTYSYIFVFLVSMSASPLIADDDFGERVPVEDFVRALYIEGLPYNKAAQYESKEVDTLFQMLEDENEAIYWPNIIVTIQIIGDESDVNRVIDFIDKGEAGEFSQYQYDAKKAAIFGLGYMVNNLESRTALEYLKKRLNPDSWNEMEGLTERHSEIGERNQDLSQYALLGLALSGTNEAIEVLKEFDRSGKGSLEFRENMEGLIGEAIRESKEIRAVGMKDYYMRSH